MRLLKNLTEKNLNNIKTGNRLITGVDIVNVGRINKILSDNREGFYNKIFNVEEIKYIEEKAHKATTVAGLFAAKEAVSKALGTGIGVLGWKDVKILHEAGGRPYINFTEEGKEIADNLGISELQISISHEKEYAIAFVVGYRL